MANSHFNHSMLNFQRPEWLYCAELRKHCKQETGIYTDAIVLTDVVVVMIKKDSRTEPL